MPRRACDGAGLLAAFRAAVANLEAHVEEINSLNVYPVPDGDTGSNMFATVRAALDEAEAVADQPADRVAAAISFGALMGARGNSGVITSQIFRGMAEALGGKRRFNGLDLAHALSRGHEDGLRRGREARRGDDPDRHPGVGRRGGGCGRARRRPGDRARRHRRRGREVGRADAEPAGDPARSGRRGFRWPGRLPAPARRAPLRRRDSAGSAHAGPGRPRSHRPSSPTPTRASATRPCTCSRRVRRDRSMSTPSARTSRRSANRCWSPATPGRSRSTSTTSSRTASSRSG